MADLNSSLFLALNAGADASWATIAFAILAAKYLILLVPLLLCALWAWGDRSTRFIALAALLALVIAVLLNQAIGLVVHSPRPFVIGLGRTLIEHRPSSSYPSNHATVCFTVAAVLLIFGRLPLAWGVAALGLLIAWARIYAGIHYPIDMLGALGSATVAALAAGWIMSRAGMTLLARAEGPYRLLFGPLIRLGLVRA